jgi:hypothetical protein
MQRLWMTTEFNPLTSRGNKMKITKRQLKRIIREEYSRLKRRGLIKESPMDMLPDSSWAGSAEQSEIDEMSPEFYIDQLMKQEYDSGGYISVDELLDNGAAYEEILFAALDQFPQMSEEEFELAWNQAGFVDQS